MVSTRGHPKAFPPPQITPSPTKATRSKRSQSPQTPEADDGFSSIDVALAITRSKSQWSHSPTPLTIIWLLVSLPLVLWDTGYVMMRPHTMPGGSWHSPFWTPYELYGKIDYIYGWPAWEARNGFTAAQASLNIVETIAYMYYLWVVWGKSEVVPGTGAGQGIKGETKALKKKGLKWFVIAQKNLAGRQGALALLVVFSASVMTLSKTVLYCKHKSHCDQSDSPAKLSTNFRAERVLLWIRQHRPQYHNGSYLPLDNS